MIKIRPMLGFVMLMGAVTVSTAQTTPPPAAEPGWAKGRPKTEQAMKMAPVPAFPMPTAADQLPTKKFKLPPGFKVETWASGVLDARELRQGDKGNIFVSTLFVGNKVYVHSREGRQREPKVIIDKMPTGRPASSSTRARLYFATNKKIVRYDNVEDKLDNPGEPKVLNDKLPGGRTTAGSSCASTTTSSTTRSARRATSATRASTRRSTA